MKRLILFSMMVLFLATTGCARWQQKVTADGSLFGSTKGDWVVVRVSANEIVDVWLLDNAFVQSEAGSDGWLFVDNDGNAVNVGGDIKAVRASSRQQRDFLFKQYIEYHKEFESITYREKLLNRGPIGTNKEPVETSQADVNEPAGRTALWGSLTVNR